MNATEILNRLNVVQVEVSCPSGAVSKTTTDRNGNEVFTDGSVRFMDRKLLRPFTAARQAAIRLCRDYGTRFLGGWAIPDDSFSAVMAGLEDIAKKFADEKKELAAVIDFHRLEWESKHPEVLEFQSKFPSTPELLHGIRISAAAYKIDPRPTGTIGDAVSEAVAGFAGKVLSEVAQEARDGFSPDATKATGRAKNTLLRIAAKLDSLAFVDASLASVSKLILDTLGCLPDGPLHGRDFAVYTGLMKTLMDPHSVVAVAQSMLQQGGPDAWSLFAGSTTATEPEGSATAELQGSETTVEPQPVGEPELAAEPEPTEDDPQRGLPEDNDEPETTSCPPPQCAVPVQDAANWQGW